MLTKDVTRDASTTICASCDRNPLCKAASLLSLDKCGHVALVVDAARVEARAGARTAQPRQQRCGQLGRVRLMDWLNRCGPGGRQCRRCESRPSRE